MDLAFAACPFVGGATPLRSPAAAADGGDAQVMLVVAPAIAPRQRPREAHSYQQHVHSEMPASARSADVMAPRREGIWAFLPYVAAAAVVGFGGWVAQKKVRARHAQLVGDFGATLSAYGASERGATDIVADYKRKVGPGVDRKGLYRSGLASLVTDIPAGVSLIRRVTSLQRLLGIKDVAAAAEVNALGKDKFADQPSLLGKLIFVSERVLADGGSAGSLRLRTMLPYSEEVVETLQRDMASRILPRPTPPPLPRRRRRRRRRRRWKRTPTCTSAAAAATRSTRPRAASSAFSPTRSSARCAGPPRTSSRTLTREETG